MVQLGWLPSARKELCRLQFLFSGAVTSVGHSYPLEGHTASDWPLGQPPTVTIPAYGILNPREGHLTRCEVEDTLGPSSNKGLFLWSSIGRPSSYILTDVDQTLTFPASGWGVCGEAE